MDRLHAIATNMADDQNTNPFLSDDQDDFIEEELDNKPERSESVSVATDISWDAIASKLLKENLILSALELHTELVEKGRELPRLRDFFSNPGNFEKSKDDSPPPTLFRTSSVQTFDSLDFARYSDDGERQVDERVAVLEFELRKAQDTIKSLRATLTKEAENEHVAPSQVEDRKMSSMSEESIKPLEYRALNFLVNQYLLQNNYKLTSVTFSEENEDQDFEDWDDVGLNISQPPDLLHLYRDYGNHVLPSTQTCDACCQIQIEMEDRMEQTDFVVEEQPKYANKKHKREESGKQEHVINKDKASLLESDAERDSSNSPRGTTGENDDTLDKTVIECLTKSLHADNRSYSVEMMETDLNIDSHIEDRDSSHKEKDQNVNHPETQIDTEIEHYENGGTGLDVSFLDELVNARDMPESFRKALMEVCYYVSKDNRLVSEVSKMSDTDQLKVVMMLGRCLPHIVPNVLLAKREELIPLIICTTMLHPDSKERDKLLNILFNLIKKPDEEQRHMILAGCVAFAEHVGPTRLEAELLPQCWEQISHKYPERRLLVAEACGVLAPYLPSEIRSSLVLSMLQQMLQDDKEEEVREAVVRSLGLLFGFICDTDKYSQGFELVKIALSDSSERVVASALHVLLPSFAFWAYELGKLEHSLLHSILKDLEDLSSASTQNTPGSYSRHPLNEGKFLLLLSTLQELIPFLYVSVIERGPYCDKIEMGHKGQQLDIDMRRFPKPNSPLTDLRTIMGSNSRLAGLVAGFEEHIAQEWFEPWDSLNWLVNNLIPRLLEIVVSAGVSSLKVVSALSRCFFQISRTFGKIFVDKKVKSRFIDVLVMPDDHIDSRVNFQHKDSLLTTCVVPVYATGVLSAFNLEEDRKQLSQFLQEVLCSLAIYQAPLDSLRTTISELSTNQSNHDLLLGVLWDGVVHTSAQVRATAARMFEILVKCVSEVLASSRIIPALVTLCNDPEISVRTATIPALGTVIESTHTREVLDRVYMQLQTFLDDSMYRDEHALHVELLRTFARVGPNAEPKFRDE
ncbi:hypothetical protein ACJMK2_010206, partial [Sinanodonta woodiana]